MNAKFPFYFLRMIMLLHHFLSIFLLRKSPKGCPIQVLRAVVNKRALFSSVDLVQNKANSEGLSRK